jgi:hypothetical protein
MGLLLIVPAAMLVPAPTAVANDLCGTTIASFSAVVLNHDHSCPAGTAITIDGDGINLDLNGFTLDGAGTGDVGIMVEQGSNDVLITDFAGAGGTVSGFTTGIELGNCTAIQPSQPVTGTVIENVTVRDNGVDGIHICPAEGGDVAVRDTRVIDSGNTGIQVGEIPLMAGTVAISSTLVRGGIVGIDTDVAESGHVDVFGSRIMDPTSIGILLSGGLESDSQVVRNSLVDCPNAISCARGIAVSANTRASIIETTVTGFHLQGIEVQGSAQDVPFTIEGSEVSNIGSVANDADEAIMIQDRLFGSITGTTVHTVFGGTGIHVACSQFTALTDNRIGRIDGDGVLVDNVPVPGDTCIWVSLGTIVRTNDLRRLSGKGVVLTTGFNHIVEGNTVLNAASDGIFVDASVTESWLTDNVVRQNDDDGFHLDAVDLELTDNVARKNGGYGYNTNGPVTLDNGNTTSNNNTLGGCSDPADLPNTNC